MKTLQQMVPLKVLQNLSAAESSYLAEVFNRFDGYPELNQIWALMDEAWVGLGCDPNNIDERVTAFYQHPVWLLNGLFIEQHGESLENRRVFAGWVSRQAPARVADFGGGFGALARLLGAALPASQVEVVEPHPHPAAIALAEETANVRFVPELCGEYDLLIATDVFEHVPDPIGLAAQTAAHLGPKGAYLMANCFRPVIRCHLPQLYHLDIAWDRAMQALGLKPGERVGYGRSYLRDAYCFDVDAARQIEDHARRVHRLVRLLPLGRARIGKLLMCGYR